MIRRISVAMVLLVAVALVTGCGPKITRMADPSAGDFYSEEEYQKLTKDQREAYCGDLLGAYRDAQACVDSATDDLATERQAVSDLESELGNLTPQLMGLRSEVQSLQSQIAYFEGLPKTYTVQKGDFLYKISGMEEIYADPLKWKRIWRANKNVIEGFNDPNLIYPNWELIIPRDWPHSYTVAEGENLWMIAKRWEIYGDGRMWERIFEANKNVLSDPNMIKPGQVLTIPR
ncbi:MAG: LysM peptidoglycan-binding domain-containing protein [Candidatus Eisenbacteria bacterium]|nr:LysM peptidoglycan-binding domain-containing protein [Candidatus Eisenbacteria bacterium]